MLAMTASGKKRVIHFLRQLPQETYFSLSLGFGEIPAAATTHATTTDAKAITILAKSIAFDMSLALETRTQCYSLLLTTNPDLRLINPPPAPGGGPGS